MDLKHEHKSNELVYLKNIYLFHTRYFEETLKQYVLKRRVCVIKKA